MQFELAIVSRQNISISENDCFIDSVGLERTFSIIMQTWSCLCIVYTNFKSNISVQEKWGYEVAVLNEIKNKAKNLRVKKFFLSFFKFFNIVFLLRLILFGLNRHAAVHCRRPHLCHLRLRDARDRTQSQSDQRSREVLHRVQSCCDSNEDAHVKLDHAAALGLGSRGIVRGLVARKRSWHGCWIELDSKIRKFLY